MDEPAEDPRVVPELYFLIAKFLSGGPLKETAKTLLKELESVEVLPRRLDWQGVEHAQSYDELASQYIDVPWTRLAAVCQRALRLARAAPTAGLPPPGLPTPGGLPSPLPPPTTATEEQVARLAARLSLLSETLVRPKPKYASHKQDHTLVRRVVRRELGCGPAAVAGGRGGEGMFPARLLSGLQLQRRTLGHLSAVYCLVFDCTGQYVITGADDLLVKVWNAVDGRLLATLRGASAEITDVSVSSDGALVAAGSVERLVRVWCLASGAPRAVLACHAGTITSVHWAPPAHPDLRYLASTSTDGSVAFWTCSREGQFTGSPVQYVERMRPGACHMICAAWSAGGAFLAAGSADQHVRLYAVGGGAPRRVLETAVHADAVDSIAWAHRGLRFVSGSKDGSAALWTLHATQWRHTLLQPQPLHNNTDQKKLKVTMVCWDRSDAYVATAVSDASVRVWSALGARELRALRGHSDEAYVLEPHPLLPHVLLSAGHDGQLFVWDVHTGEVLSSFRNEIAGQGAGALFDAKWGGPARVAASDSHGHLLLLGLGRGHPRLRQLPTDLFFHTDYRPLARDALGGALDEQTQTPPHLLPPPFLVDVEGAPYPPELQRLVPGRENLAVSQLIPAADAARSRLDAMILALQAGEQSPPPEGARGGGGGGGVWRGEGVRHTLGSWQRGDPHSVPLSTRPIVPLCHNHSTEELYEWEQAWWRREMRRRPLMINTAVSGEPAGPRRRAGRRRGAGAAPPRRRQPAPAPAPAPASASSSHSPDGRSSPDHSHSDSLPSSVDLTDSSSSHSGTKSDDSVSSQYSDWALGPPARTRRRPAPADRYSPSTTTTKRGTASGAVCNGRAERATARADAEAEAEADAEAERAAEVEAEAEEELPEAYRVGEWLTAVVPRKAPYHPQMGDECLYFRLGHQRYFEAVAEKDLYKINPRDKPWERTVIHECERVKVIGIKYVIKPPRVVCLRLACVGGAGGPGAAGGSGPGGARPRTFTVRYHDMPDVIDFMVLTQQYSAAAARRWSAGDRFRCIIDDSWWTGVVVERAAPPYCLSAPWDAAAAAQQFLSLRVRWDNGEMERLSPWDLEPLDGSRLPAEPGGAVAVLPAELRAVLYRPQPHEWPPAGDRAAASAAIAQHVSHVMTLSVAEPFAAPVDLQRYPSYARVVPYPVDLSTIRARFENLFYRRCVAAQFDVRYLASNAELYNAPHAPIVRQARLLTALLLHVLSNWQSVDVLAKYRELCATYHSTDDEDHDNKRAAGRRAGVCADRPVGSGGWRPLCAGLLQELLASPDSEPFRQPVAPELAPDYLCVVSHPMDLGTVRDKLSRGEYATRERLARDVRTVFANSRLYNTNKRSRIYSMTVRLSSLFEALWSRLPAEAEAACGRRARRVRRARRGVRDSSSEPLAAHSRRAHAARAAHAASSSDSDLPLASAHKGKGVGKKSKSSGNSNTTDPLPSTSAGQHHLSYSPPREVHVNGIPSGSDSESGGTAPRGRGFAAPRGATGGSSDQSSAYSPIRVVEEELAEDEVELTYEEPDRSRHQSRKRRRASSGFTPSEGASGSGSGSSGEWRERTHRRKHKRKHKRKPKRRRERATRESWSESGSESEEEERDLRRYESDRSYRPRYSTDDDAPLHLYRQRQQGEGAGPSSSRRRKKGVSLRARRSPRRYNEDSESDAALAISKRGRRPPTRPPAQPPTQPPRPPAEHDYARAQVSVSSRGRVRKPTAKARGLD